MSSKSSSSVGLLPPFLTEEAFVDAPEAFEEYEPVGRAALRERARAVLLERMGRSDSAISTAHAFGTVGVQADQTHYSDGFGLFMPLRQGVAVAAREAESSRITFAAGADPWTDDADDPPPWIVLVRRIVRELLVDRPVEVAVVSTVPNGCLDGYLAALAVAVMRAMRSLDVSTGIALNTVQELRDELVPLLAGEIGSAFDRPYSSGYLLATVAGADPSFTLVDTATHEHLPVETEARRALQWAVVDPGGGEPRSPDFHQERQAQAKEALDVLRSNGFEGLTAFRDLEHRVLEDAVAVLPPTLRPITRHLVGENRRVQKHVAAMRRADWQMVGALLLMSHASQREDWASTSTAADAVVNEIETQIHSDLYGACMTGRSGAVLLVGRPAGFSRSLRRLSEALVSVLGQPPRILAP